MNVRDLTCERCAALFACGSGDPAGCWCAALSVDREVRAGLRGLYADCLCPACLFDMSTSGSSRLPTDDEKAGPESLRPAFE